MSLLSIPRRSTLILLVIVLLALMPVSVFARSNPTSDSGVYRVTYQSNGRYLVAEVLDDDLVHFQLSTTAPGDQAILTTPMVAKVDYAGPTQIKDDGAGTLETPALRVKIDTTTLCATITDTARSPELRLTTLCPRDPRGLTLTREGITDVYGLGEQFSAKGLENINWIGRRRLQVDFGNSMVPLNGGSTANAQFPVMYALGQGTDSYAVFVDHTYPQKWDFTADPWLLDTPGEPLRWYVMTGPDLADLRSDYMELAGRPPVPPRQMFGMWVSEYGYDNWNELLGVLDSLEKAHFPVDGFVLDLQWFGGVGPKGYIGSLAWDQKNFPDPAAFIAQLRAQHGASLMVIEESYVNQTLPDYAALNQQGILVRQCEGCAPVKMAAWWGIGGMVDWTNPAGADTWHDLRRQHLIDEGVIGHWTDLGEPEYYDPRGWYYGFPDQGLHKHADVHNVYNLLWAESIYRGYQRNSIERRPFILSRSGTSGIERYGAALWSGDIGSNMTSLAAHYGAQFHMSLSGVDYFGADIGGFMRRALEPGADMNEMYTIWFANGIMTDVPGRTHTYNLTNAFQTSPSRIGDLTSNLANVRQRYALSPYLYSLAHRAFLYGEAVEPPLVYYFQTDPNVRSLGGEKMIGPDLLLATVTEYGKQTTDVYLPAGDWYNYHTGERVTSAGEWIKDVPLYHNGAFQVPLFVRAGAVIPQMYVDDQTANVLGQRRDGSVHDELILSAYAGFDPSRFTLYEDDGETMAYQRGEVRTTVLTQGVSDKGGTALTIEAADGTYAGAPAARDNVIHFMTGGAEYVEVILNGEVLTRFDTQAEFNAAERGWYAVDIGHLVVKSGPMDVSTAKTFDFLLARG